VVSGHITGAVKAASHAPGFVLLRGRDGSGDPSPPWRNFAGQRREHARLTMITSKYLNFGGGTTPVLRHGRNRSTPHRADPRDMKRRYTANDFPESDTRITCSKAPMTVAPSYSFIDSGSLTLPDGRNAAQPGLIDGETTCNRAASQTRELYIVSPDVPP